MKSKYLKSSIIHLVLWMMLQMLVGEAYSQVQLNRKLRIFFDCANGCDEVYFKSKIKVVDFILNRSMADIHVLVTNAANGAGGYNYQLIFYGQQSFTSRIDTFYCTISANNTQVEAREKVLAVLQGGLLPFIAQTPQFEQVEINMQSVEESMQDATGQAIPSDKWNYWVFNAGADGNVVMDAVYSTRMLKGSIGVNRTTPQQRISFSMTGNYSGSTYKVATGGAPIVYRVVNSDYIFNHAFVSAINDHWSWAYTTTFSSNTFNNIRFRKYLGAGIEYAFFPYSDINTRFFTLNYRLEAQQNFYYDTTIYNKVSELLPGHRVEANLSVKQKWGNLSASLAYTNFMKDHLLNNLNYNLSFDLRITGGLTVYIYSSGALVHDQIYLARGDASAEDILTKRRQLKSGYNFYSGVGLNFRFGSMMNNFVNPRFLGY